MHGQRPIKLRIYDILLPVRLHPLIVPAGLHASAIENAGPELQTLIGDLLRERQAPMPRLGYWRSMASAFRLNLVLVPPYRFTFDYPRGAASARQQGPPTAGNNNNVDDDIQEYPPGVDPDLEDADDDGGGGEEDDTVISEGTSASATVVSGSYTHFIVDYVMTAMTIAQYYDATIGDKCKAWHILRETAESIRSFIAGDKGTGQRQKIVSDAMLTLSPLGLRVLENRERSYGMQILCEEAVKGRDIGTLMTLYRHGTTGATTSDGERALGERAFRLACLLWTQELIPKAKEIERKRNAGITAAVAEPSEESRNVFFLLTAADKRAFRDRYATDVCVITDRRVLLDAYFRNQTLQVQTETAAGLVTEAHRPVMVGTASSEWMTDKLTTLTRLSEPQFLKYLASLPIIPDATIFGWIGSREKRRRAAENSTAAPATLSLQTLLRIVYTAGRLDGGAVHAAAEPRKLIRDRLAAYGISADILNEWQPMAMADLIGLLRTTATGAGGGTTSLATIPESHGDHGPTS